MLSSGSWSRSELRRTLARFVPVVSLLLVALTGCASGGGPPDRDVLISLTDEVVVPAYESLAQEMARLDRDVDALCEAPGEASLETARQSWYDARASWMRTEAM